MSEHRENEHYTNEHRNILPYIALFIAGGYLLAVCMLVAFLIGFLMAGPLAKTFETGIWPLVKMYAGGAKGGSWSPPGGGPKIMGTVAVIPGKGGAQFNPPGIKLPAGNTVTWINKTGEAQTLITDSNSKNITLTPGQPMSMSFPEAGRIYTWHLASNPQASITVYVGGR